MPTPKKGARPKKPRATKAPVAPAVQTTWASGFDGIPRFAADGGARPAELARLLRARVASVFGVVPPGDARVSAVVNTAARTGLAEDLYLAIAPNDERQADGAPGTWVPQLLQYGGVGTREAAALLLECGDWRDFGTNLLSALGNAISFATRRAILRDVLVANGWSLVAAARELKMGGSGSVVRLIRDLELGREYAAAKRAGAGRPGPKPGG